MITWKLELFHGGGRIKMKTGLTVAISLSTAIDKINAAVGKVNTLATKLSDLASSGDDS